MPSQDEFIGWLKLVGSKSYYEILRVNQRADAATIKEAFHRFAMLCHPDRYVEDLPANRELAAEAFKRGAEAYRVLSRPEVRARYDKAIAHGKIRLDEKALSEPPPAPVGKTLEMVARTAKGKGFAVKADRLLSIGKLEDARLQLVNACQCEPDNSELTERLTLIYEALALEPL